MMICLFGRPADTVDPRTSDSLNEGLPIEIVREKFQRKYFFHEKDSRFNSLIISKSILSHYEGGG